LTDNQSIVSLHNVSYTTPDGRSLGSNINSSLGAGEVLLVTGPNGSGKTTLLEIILGRQTCNSGTVQLNLPATSISYLPQLQDSETHMPFSLRDVLTTAMPAKARARMDDATITSHGLLELHQLDLGWNHASGGEKRRTLLTRTLLKQPRLLILDEPFNHLDQDSRRAMVSAISRVVTTGQTSVILTTHEGFANEAALAALTIRRISL
jgi:ABC-type Mn2+/Zn2+ transport system ATPase subunit